MVATSELVGSTAIPLTDAAGAPVTLWLVKVGVAASAFVDWRTLPPLRPTQSTFESSFEAPKALTLPPPVANAVQLLPPSVLRQIELPWPIPTFESLFGSTTTIPAEKL